MKFLKSFPIINRWFGFFVAILLTVGLGGYDYAVIQAAEKKVERLAEIEMPLILAEKELAAAGDTAEDALQGFLGSNGDELDKTQFHQQVAIMEYRMDALKKLNTAEEFNTLLSKNREWLIFAEKEILNATPEKGVSGEEYVQNLEAAHAQINSIQAGYREQIAAQKHVIQELEQEVVTSEITSNILIDIMSLILAVSCISLGFILFRKILTAKVIKVSNAAEVK